MYPESARRTDRKGIAGPQCSRSRRCFERCQASHQLDGASLERVAAAGDLAEVVAGDVLFREGTLPESLYVLLDGQVSLTGTAADASSTVIDILGPASSFVLANVLMDEPYLMGAEAIAGSRLVRIGAEPMRAAGGVPTGRRHGDDARDVGGTRQHDAAGGGPEGAHRGAAARHVSAEPGEGADRDTGTVPAAGPQGAAGGLARLPRREPVARLHVVARLWCGDAWFPGGAARHLAPAGLCRRDRARRPTAARSRGRRWKRSSETRSGCVPSGRGGV